MRTVQAVAWKEIQIYFSSPTAYIVAMIFLALASFFFVRGLSPINENNKPKRLTPLQNLQLQK